MCNEVENDLQKCIEKRIQTIDAVKDLAKKLDKHHINVARAKVVGSTAKIVGTGAAAAFGGSALFTIAVGLAPFTGGLNLSGAVVVGGTALAALGGAAVAGRH